MIPFFITIVDYLKEYSRLVTIGTIFVVSIFLWYMPVLFGMVLLITTLIFLIGTFNPMQIRNSLMRLFIFLCLLGLVFTPLFISFAVETHKLNHPELIIDSSDPVVLENSREFQEIYFSQIDGNNLSQLCSALEDFVYTRYPYEIGHVYLFPTTRDVVSGKNSDCRGRALIGYGILEYLGYDAYIACGLVDGPHAWIRVLKDGEYYDTFLLDDNRPDHEPLVIVNEFKSQWSSPYEQLFGIIFHGFYVPDKALLIISSLIFIIPIGAGSIFIVLQNRNTNAITYVAVIVISGILVLIPGLVMIENEMLRPISYIIAGGIYLRILNLIFPSGDM